MKKSTSGHEFYSIAHCLLFCSDTWPKACWNDGSQKLCKDLILTVGTRLEQNLNQEFSDLEPSAQTTELSHYQTVTAK